MSRSKVASGSQKVTVTEHLHELRRRLLRSVIAVLITTTASFFFAEKIFTILKSPAGDIQLIRTEVVEMLGVYMKVSLYSGLALALPFIVYQLVMFLRPGMAAKEKKYLYILLPSVAVSFLAGSTFAFFFILPPALKFLLGFGEDIAIPLIRVGNYVSLVVTLIFWIGVAFEIPLVIFFLAKLHLVSPRMLARGRRYAILAAFVLGAIITPTIDPINQSIVAGMIVVLYELGILFARLAWREEPKPVSSDIDQDDTDDAVPIK